MGAVRVRAGQDAFPHEGSVPTRHHDEHSLSGTTFLTGNLHFTCYKVFDPARRTVIFFFINFIYQKNYIYYYRIPQCNGLNYNNDVLPVLNQFLDVIDPARRTVYNVCCIK